MRPAAEPRRALWQTRAGLAAAGIVAALVAVVHLATANRYDLFVNELYFIVCGRHPAFGYVDQPPLIPLLSALTQIGGTHVWLLRLPAVLAAVALVPLTVAFAQSLRLIVNQRLVPSTDGKRTPLREFLAFDDKLRRRFLDTDPDRWPALAQDTVDAGEHGQSFAVAIRRALAAGRITEDLAQIRLKELGYVA